MGSRIKSLQNKQPVANQKLAQQQQAANDLRLQQAVGSAPAGQTTKATSQQMGAAQATQAAGQNLQREQQGAATNKALSGLAVGDAAQQRTGALQDKNLATRGKEFDLNMIASKLEREGRSDLAARANELQRQRNTTEFENGLAGIQLLEGLASNDRELKEYLQVAEHHNKMELQDMRNLQDSILQDISQMGRAERAELEREFNIDLDDLIKKTNSRIGSIEKKAESFGQWAKGASTLFKAGFQYGN